jgi:hypothetical protein
MPATPNQLGRPCWALDQVPNVIQQTAQTTAASAACFLAAHSPFRKITDAKTAGRTLSEEEVFKDIFSSARGQVQAFVKGQPGTGKSHLIRWLKERSDYASRDKKSSSERRRVVLVTRGNGSLKDALGQIVRQLGQEFERHLNRVQGAIDNLSDRTARAMLLSELALEVDTRWTNEHGRKPLPNSLQHLGQALRSNGFGGWMKRDGGVIHSVIQRLTDSSTVEDRETFPAFTPEDVVIPLTYLQPGANARQVLDFAEDLAEEPETRELAAQTLNAALQDAIRAMTGLKGDDLLSIFTEIRRQLGPDRVLVVLIEDVSVTGLDQDVVNAFEPRSGDGLCRMIAVLGITENAWLHRLPDNLRQRATHVYEVGGSTVQQWAADPEEIARFTARYLNAIRSTDEELQAIAEERFEGDIRRSRCDECACRQECHAAFGKVVFDSGIEVGMFPFTKHAPYLLLQNLSDAPYRSQRGLLDHVLLSGLQRSYDSLQSRRFPRPLMFPVNRPASTIWAGFENRYCGGAAWSSEQKERLRFLAQFWVNASTPDALAAALQPFLQPLDLPSFSSKPVSAPRPPEPPQRQGGRSEVPPPHPSEDRELKRLLELLDKWHAGQPLQEDSKYRELLYYTLNNSIVWQDSQQAPIVEKKRLLNKGGRAVPRIEGQTTAPIGTYKFDFPRNSETRDLLQGLLMLSRAPDKTWSFPDGELHKRAVSRWLRKHQARVIESVQPESPSLAPECLRAAVQALALTALLRDRKKLPEGRADRLAAIFSPSWSATASPVVLSPDLSAVVSDLQMKSESLREFLVNELGAGQGDANPTDFINPVPLLELLADFEKRLPFDPPPAEAASSYWGPRFSAVKTFSQGAFASIPDRLEKERRALGDVVAAVRSFVGDAGFENKDLRAALEACLAELNQLIELQRGAQRKPGILPLPNGQLDELWQRGWLQKADVRSSWGAAVGRALEVSEGKSQYDLSVFNVAKLMECVESLRLVEHHLNLVDQEMKVQEDQVGPQDDTRSQMLVALDEIAALLEAGGKGESDSE